MWTRILYLPFITLFISCSFETEDLSNIYDLLYMQRNGATMPVHIHGNAESKVFVVVLHGGPGGNGLAYRPGVFKEELEKEYAVAYYDQRGQGMSQGHLDKESTNLLEMVEDVKALISVIKHKYGDNSSVFLLGHSWGGTLGTAFMVTKDYQESIRGWIEVDGAHDFDLLVKEEIKMIQRVGIEEIASDRSAEFWQEFIDKAKMVDTADYSLKDIGELNVLSYEAEEKLIEANLIRDGTADYQDSGLLLKSTLLSTNPITSYFTGKASSEAIIIENDLFETRIADQLHRIEKPTLLLWGAYDFVVPPQLGRQAFERINTQDKKLVIFQESGHSPMWNEGELFKNEVIEFIETYK